MRNLVLLFMAVILGTSASFANTADDKVAERNTYRYNNSFIFVEQGITFAVYPDGEFDFYIDNRLGNNRRNVTFNSGFDYSPYAQYDDYGAVIQVENIPVFYDYYGRVSEIGSVDISYRNGRVRRLGNMNVFYNRRGFYDYHTGYINIYNRSYIYRPFHSFFARPALGFCFVRTSPYRRYYNPFRYTYYNPYRFNRRRAYAKIGKQHRYNQVRRERASIYRNDKRVALRENRTRSNRNVTRGTNNNTLRTNRNKARRGDVASNGRTVRSNRGTSVKRSGNIERSNNRRNDARSSNNGRTIKRSTTTIKRTPQRNAVTKRKVTQTPRSRTVTKRTVRKPTQRASRNTGVSSRSSSQRSVTKAPSRSRSVASRSSSSRRSVSKAPARSRNTTARSSSSRGSSNKRSAATSRSRGRQ